MIWPNKATVDQTAAGPTVQILSNKKSNKETSNQHSFNFLTFRSILKQLFCIGLFSLAGGIRTQALVDILCIAFQLHLYCSKYKIYFYMGTILGLVTWCSSDFGINDTHVQLASLLMVTLIYLCLRPSCLGNLYYIEQFFLYVADIKLLKLAFTTLFWHLLMYLRYFSRKLIVLLRWVSWVYLISVLRLYWHQQCW